MKANGKIRIRPSNPRVEKYLTESGKWTKVRCRAATFETSEEAISFANKCGIIRILLDA